MNRHYPNLFRKGKLGNRKVKNRIVMSPMGDNMANADGSVSEQSIAYYSARAKGGAGIIIPGVACVDAPRGKTIACQYRLDGVKFINGWARLAREVHRYGALLIPQISFVGQAGDIEITEGTPLFRVSDPVDEDEKQLPSSKVDLEFDIAKHQFETITREQLIELEKKYIKAAKNAQLAGCDGVEVHCISYIIGQLATKSINLRTDEYGGSLENRLRFPLNVIRGIRKECGPDFIIGARIPVHKWETDGFTYEESAKLAKAYEEAGCDFLDANGGLPPRISCLMETSRYEQGYRVDLAAFIKKVVNIPVFTVGNLREPDFCEQVLANGKADYIMLGRALIADPEWPNKAAAGKADEIRPCISCLHACFGNLAKHQSIQCVLNPEVSYESILQTVKPPEKAKRIIIIGGGIAGMQAAITAHDRGHSVTLLEKEEQLGGQLKVASAAPHKQNISKVKDWFVKQVEKRNIDVRFRFNGSVRVIQVMNPDLVLVATGSVPCKPDIPGIKKAIQAWDVLLGKAKLPEGQKVAILGGGTVGCEVAELLAEKGHQVTVFEMTDQIARGLEGANTLDLLEVIEKLKIDIRLNSKVTEIDENKVCYEENGTAKSEEFQQIILALGQKSNCDNIVNGLESAGIEYKIIGDALKPSNFHNATSTAYFAALDA